jgi:tRNA pseudouridine55 synthase
VRHGIGGHLSGLRRTRSGAATLERAVSLAAVEATLERVDEVLVPMADMLPEVPALWLTDAGATRARHGARLGVSDFVEVRRHDDTTPTLVLPRAPVVRLMSPRGELLGIARSSSTEGAVSPDVAWALHPMVVLA